MSKLIHYSGPAGSYILPSGYTRLAYIQSTGTLWVDSGLIGSNNTTIICEYQLTETPDASHLQRLFGARASNLNRALVMAFTNDGINRTYCNIGGNLSFAITGKGDLNKHILILTPTYITIDYNRITTSKSFWYQTYTGQTFTTPGNIYLCAYNNNGSALASTYAKVYSFKIYEDGIIKRDMIPVQKFDGTIGLLDLVNNTFYGNSGTGTFIAGPECPLGFPTSEYCLVEWLWNDDRTAWIELPRTLKANTIMKAEMQITNSISGTYQQVMGYATSTSWNPYGLGTNNNSWACYGGSVTPSIPPTTAITTVTWTNTGESAEITGSTLGLFKMSGNPGDSNWLRAAIKLLRCLVLEGTTVVMDLIPCYRRSDMLPGVYDIVGRAFYTNTVGKFSLGPSITFGWGEVMNEAGKNLYSYSTNRTISVGASNLTNRISNLGFNGIAGPWTISFDALATANVNVSMDICDRGNKTITITPTKLHFSITAIAADYYTPTAYNGFWDMQTSGPNGITITLTNIMMLRGSVDTGYIPNINLSSIPHNISSGEGRMGEKNGSFNFSGTNIYLNTDGLVTGKTYMGWFYTASKPAREVFFADSASGIAFGTYNNGTQAIVATANSSNIIFTLNTWNIGWNHITVVKSDNGPQLYINGIAQTATSSTNGWTHNGGLWIGARSTFDASFSGRCQDFKVFDTALTQAQIQQEM